jgi:erythromycin esterase-like protein
MDAVETPGFRDRAHAGRRLAQRLRSDYAGRDDTIVLALRRGGVPMAETLDALTSHLEHTTGSAEIVVRAHNSHRGDARATELGKSGEPNLSQIVRERHGDECFTTYSGTVTAASDWGGPAERQRVRRAAPGSWEELFHSAALPRFLLSTPPKGRRLERAIGVIYRHETERLSRYFHARLADQFDAAVHIDEARPLGPLERSSGWDADKLPETCPWGM